MTPKQLRQKALMAAAEKYNKMRNWNVPFDDLFITSFEAALDVCLEDIGFIKSAQEEQEFKQPTLRDQFAMAALRGQLARQPADDWLDLAEFCYIMADTMLAARK